MRIASFFDTKQYQSLVVYGLLGVMIFGSIQNVQAQVFFNSTHISNWSQQVEQPALVGTSSGIRTLAAFRYQWVGLEGTPMTAYVGADMKLPLKNVSGGAFVSHDRLGAASFTSAHVAVAYSFPLGASNALNLGTSIGVNHMLLDGSKLTTPSGLEDPILSDSKQGGMRPDLGIGIAYLHRYVQVGVLVKNIANFKTKLNGVASSFRADYGRYVSVSANGMIPISESVSVDPSFGFRYDGSRVQTDVSASATMFNKYSVGVGARGYNKKSFESFIILTKLDLLDNISLMYSVDVAFNKIKTVSHGSHELSFQYVIPRSQDVKRKKTMNHPRYL